LHLHYKDDELVCLTGNTLLATLKELPFNEVKLKFINAGMAKECLTF
jgi:hypothetical protein